jgi:hypothetical protein
MQAILLTLSAVLEIIAPLTYIVSIMRGKSKPHRMTRFILLFVLSLNFFGIVAAKGNLGAVVFSGINVTQATAIFLLSLKRGMGGTNSFDKVCLVVAGIGIVGWKITGNPVAGIWFAVFADFFGYLPAFFKTWKHPHTESAWYYLLGALSAFLSFIAFPIDATSIFQIYIAVSCIVMVGFIYRNNVKKLFR